MAFPSFRGRRVFVFYYPPGGTRQKALPREQTRHLDGEPEEVVREWVTRWSNLNEIQKVRPDLVTSALPAKWQKLIDDFCSHLKAKGRADNTISDHRRHVETSLPFFIEQGCSSLSDFPKYSRKLGDWLLGRGKTPRRVYAINQSLQVFWRYLDVNRGLVEGVLRLVGGQKDKAPTPLKLTIAPTDILSFAFTKDDIKLFALLGYFFSLRPQEVLALTPGHFKAGSTASTLECCKTLANVGLYDKLAVHIVRQKVGNKFKDPKKNSVGWVGCFNPEAAKVIVKLLIGKKSTDLLFPHRVDTYIKK